VDELDKGRTNRPADSLTWGLITDSRARRPKARAPDHDSHRILAGGLPACRDLQLLGSPLDQLVFYGVSLCLHAARSTYGPDASLQ
jgi:hypothetical protein